MHLLRTSSLRIIQTLDFSTTFFAVLGRSPDWMLVVQSGERSRVENVRI